MERLTAGERKTFWACFGGWALDGMDYQLYSFVIPSIIAGWHISKGQAGYLATGTLLFSAVGGWMAGLLADRLGRKPNFYLFSLCSMGTVLVYALLPVTDREMLVLGFPLGFFASGIFSGIGPFFTELFSTRIRGSGQGFSYNFGRGAGALFPCVIGALSAGMPLGRAIGSFAAAAYAVLFIAAVFLPETRGKELSPVA